VPSNRRENTIAGVLLVLAILLGVFPYPTLLRYMDKTIDRQVNELAAWTKEVKLPALEAARKPKPERNLPGDLAECEVCREFA